jgi:hypothetical protein
MNCKPNDRAIIISSRFHKNIGTFVIVRKVAFFDNPELGYMWTFDSASKPLILAGFREARMDIILATETTEDNKAYLRDCDLQRIGDSTITEIKELSVKA